MLPSNCSILTQLAVAWLLSLSDCFLLIAWQQFHPYLSKCVDWHQSLFQIILVFCSAAHSFNSSLFVSVCCIAAGFVVFPSNSFILTFFGVLPSDSFILTTIGVLPSNSFILTTFVMLPRENIGPTGFSVL